MKRGQAAQFNWIFVLVAGIIIIGFFSVFIFKYVELENKKSSFRIVNYLNTGLDVVERESIYSEDLIDLFLTTKLDFMCVGDDFLVIVNNHEDLAYGLGDKVVFAPSSIKDDSLGAWIYEWNYPFLVAKFLFLTSSKYKYIFVGDVPEEINKIPDEVFNIEHKNSVDKVNDPSNTKVVFFSGINNGEMLVNTYEDLEVIYVDTDNKKVTFYKNGDVFDYFGDAFLYGAIFSGSAENYKCAMNNALSRLKLISRIYSGKNYLYGKLGNQECVGLSSSLDSFLSVFKKYDVGEGNLDSNAEKLRDINLDLHGRGCRNLF